MKVLMVQPRLCWQDASENRARLETQISAALAGGKADLIVLPETFTTGFLGDVGGEPEGMNGATVVWMRELASAHDAAMAGSVVIGEDGQRFNRFLFVPPEEEIHYYDKRHLFAYGGENTRYLPGRRRVVLSWRDWRICPQICYDLRFPVWCRNRDDYDLLLFVANWPAPRVHAWSTLLVARAIENQSFVIGINRVGEDGNGIAYPGQSAAIDPLGKALVSMGGDVASQLVTLDIEELRDVRARLPFLADADPFSLDV